MKALVFSTRKAAEAYTFTVEGWLTGFGLAECYRIPNTRKWVVRILGRGQWVVMAIDGRPTYYSDAELNALGRK